MKPLTKTKAIRMATSRSRSRTQTSQLFHLYSLQRPQVIHTMVLTRKLTRSYRSRRYRPVGREVPGVLDLAGGGGTHHLQLGHAVPIVMT
jgi:hypothetical protein